MSKYFSVRNPLTVTIGEQSHTFYVRELSYARFIEINQLGMDLPKNDRGMLILKTIVLESVEEEDGSKSYDEASWRDELQRVVDQIGKAAMKAHGIDLERTTKEEEPLTEEQAEGNAEPSRKYGASSQSSSAAPLANFNIA